MFCMYRRFRARGAALGRQLHVLYCDNHVIAVEKEAGVPVVPDSSRDRSLLEEAKAWVKEKYSKPGAVFLGVVHRLDRPASGVVVFGRTSKGASRLSASFRERRAQKVYLARSARTLPADLAERCDGGACVELEQWLLKDRDANRVALVEPGSAGAKRAETRLALLQPRPQRQQRGGSGSDHASGTLLKLEPITGRSHQLRVACASLGLPLLGDIKYGCRRPLEGGRAIALHAVELRVPHPVRPHELLRICSQALPAWAAGYNFDDDPEDAGLDRSREDLGHDRTT